MNGPSLWRSTKHWRGRAKAILSPAYPPLASAWDLARVHSSWTGRNVSVAVIDTHVDAGHPDLKGRIKVARNFTPQAQIMALRACWQRGSNRASACTSLNLARAMNYAIERGAKIINLSLGGPPNRLLTRLIDTAGERGIAVVAAHDPALPKGGFPASHRGVIAVSQEGVAGARGYAAPGRDIPTTQPDGGFHFVTGSSYSAAHVSGLLALSYERNRASQGRENGEWHTLEHTDTKSRKIDIAKTFD